MEPVTLTRGGETQTVTTRTDLVKLRFDGWVVAPDATPTPEAAPEPATGPEPTPQVAAVTDPTPEETPTTEEAPQPRTKRQHHHARAAE